MERLSPEELQRNVAAQADFRLKFGLLVATAIVLIHYLVPYEAKANAAVVLGIYCFYGLYAGAARYLAARPGALTLRDLVMVTAVIDPLFLSAWLFIAGESAFLVVGMYLFTILGFGFRVGASPMHVCQVMSLVGFLVVITLAPAWQDHLLYALSHMVLLVLVPVYASFLIKRIRAAKALAEHESQAKSRLLAKVSHELRTPLTGIIAASQLMEVESREADTVKRARSIQHLANSLEAEIKQLLELSTIEHRRHRNARRQRSFHLADTANRAYKSLESIAEAKGLAVHLDYDESIKRPVIGHEDEIVAVLTNLAGNAVKFTEQGSITLQLRMVSSNDTAYQVWFGVTDTGIGIAPEHLERIFEPFYQVAEGRTHASGGTGLGTTIAKELVTGMGGELHVTSTVGEGSVFWFVLEFKIDSAPEAAAVSGSSAGHALNVHSKRVLIADDNAINLELMKQMLQKDGHLVTAVTSGHEALGMLASESFDIVFLDYNMDGVDGAMVFQTYKFSRVDIIPTFFVTADTSEMTARLLEGLDAAGVIYKPVTFEKIRQAFAVTFPGEAAAGASAPSHAKRGTAELSTVPIAYVDLDMIDALREIKDTPEFLIRIIGDAMADLTTLRDDMSRAIMDMQIPAVHRVAHTMKGVALSVGAVRLGSLAGRMMELTYTGLESDQGRWQRDVSETMENTLAALGEVKRGLAPPHAVNH
ncbi:ATP-binding protein [Luteimonas suaedae]|uniref:ATP-binding protein n=1 Tax=Luteimonas suaedae TaxID=2605430 RepID=UPI0011EDCD3C|nr:ATP-binding protein [Luteimonas suaedae]